MNQFLSTIDQAKSILRGEDASIDKIIKLVKALKKERAFNYARRILTVSRDRHDLTLDQGIFIDQQCALCTYKDQDLPIIKRLDAALAILKEARLNLDNTKDQETLGIAGAIYKRKWEANGQRRELERSLYYYNKGYQFGCANDFGYTGINAAYIHDLLAWRSTMDTLNSDEAMENADAHHKEAKLIREDIIATLPSLAERKDTEWLGQTWWYLVTVAEAYFGLKDYENARKWIQKAMALEGTPEWEKESATRQLAQLALIHQSGDTIRAEGSPANMVLMDLTSGSATALHTIFSGKVGLALSGGGFRASLYHIGVLARLAELDMLRHIEVISCVSGGSILGAHYYLEVKRLLETKPDEQITREDYIDIVQKMSNEFLDGVQRNIRTRVIADLWQNLKMFWSKNYSRTMRAGELYEKELFSKVKDGNENQPRWIHDLFISPINSNGNKMADFKPKYDNWRRKSKVPILILNATTLNTGHNWQFTASWMGESPSTIQEIDGNYRLRRMYYKSDEGKLIENRKIRLGYAVAASACVPGMFEPLSLHNLYENKVVRLVDGGVHDNQGVCGLLEQDCTVLLFSDASGQMGSEDDPQTSVLGVPMRANDILMERVRNEQFSDMENRYRAGLLKSKLFIHLKLDLDVQTVDWRNCEDPSDETLRTVYAKQLAFYGIRKKLQEKIAAVRTDLDSFNDTEAAVLMSSGYLMLTSVFEKNISGFPISLEKEWNWWFLMNTAELKREDAPKNFIQLIDVAKERMFKIWRLSGFLKILAVLLGIAALILIVWAVITWYNQPVMTVGQIAWSILGVVGGMFVGKIIIRAIRYRDTAIRFATGLGLVTLGWIVSNLHLLVFDRLYLKRGRLRNQKSEENIMQPQAAPVPS